MPFAQDAITVNRLQLRGEKSATQEAVRAMQTIHAPETGQRWYLIRQIELKTRPQQMAQQFSSQVERLIQQAIHGAQTGADQAPAIFFYSLAELLKQLSLDIHRGQGQQWYWQQWLKKTNADPAAAKLSKLWCQHAAHLPELCLHLAQQGVLTQVWRSFSAQQCQEISLAYCLFLGLDAQPFVQQNKAVVSSANPEQPPHKEEEPVSPSFKAHSQLALTQLMHSLPAALHHSWQTLIEEKYAQAPDQTASPSISLALLLSASSWQPTQLAVWQKHWPQITKLWIQQSLLTSSSQTSKTTEATPAPPLLETRLNNVIHINKPLRSEATFQTPSKTLLDDDSSRAPHINPSINETARHQSPYGIISHQAGLFYLINPITRFLRQHPEHYTVLLQTDAGWALLYQLGRLLESTLVDELSQDTGLKRLFLQLQDHGNDDAITQLARMDLGPLPQAIVDAIHSQPALAALCGPALLQRCAHIQLDQSHMDIFYTSQSIDLDVRIAGLDINPAWVDWLGRVVSFHYRDGEQNQ